MEILVNKDLDKEVYITENDLIGAITYWAYAQSPNRKPENIETVVQKVKDFVRSNFENVNETYMLSIKNGDIKEYVSKMLREIPEFVDWNLSYNERQKGISVDDESRPKYSFITRYDAQNPESWKDDFVDLEAFVQNVYWLIMVIHSRFE